MEIMLNSCKYLRVPLQDLDNLVIRLLDDANIPGQLLGPSSKTCAMMWRPEKSDSTRRTQNILEMPLRLLLRLNQSLPLYFSFDHVDGNHQILHTSSQTNPPRL